MCLVDLFLISFIGSVAVGGTYYVYTLNNVIGIAVGITLVVMGPIALSIGKANSLSPNNMLQHSKLINGFLQLVLVIFIIIVIIVWSVM